MPFIKLSKTERRKLTLFFTCLGLAVVTWLFFAFSNQYIYQVRTLVNYINFPKNKAFHSLQSDTVNLQVEGTGWQLLFSKLRIRPQSVDVDLRALNKTNFVTFTDQLLMLNRQFETNQRVISVQPDTLYFDFTARTTKKIPIRLSYNLDFEPQYGISGGIELNPDYVTVTGPLEDIVRIESWPTDSIVLKNVKNDISSTISLKKSGRANINIFPNSVAYKIAVDEFTQKTVQVPLKVINNPSFLEVKLVPDYVQVTILAALNNYTTIGEDQFEATVDLKKWEENGYKELPVNVSRHPQFSKLVRVKPQQVNFIINK